jgi:hypothetical protein
MTSIIVISILLIAVSVFIGMKKQVNNKMSTLSPDEFRKWFEKNYMGMGEYKEGVKKEVGEDFLLKKTTSEWKVFKKEPPTIIRNGCPRC